MDTNDLISRIKNRDIGRRDLLQGMGAAGLAVVMTPVMSQAAKAAAPRQDDVDRSDHEGIGFSRSGGL